MEYNVDPKCMEKIRSFYENVAKKYKYTYSYELMQKNIKDAYCAIFKIENGLLRRNPTIQRWSKYFMANHGKWFYAYTITKDKQGNDVVNVVDACHAQNMSDNATHQVESVNERLYYNFGGIRIPVRGDVSYSKMYESANFINGFEIVEGDGLKHTCDSLQQFGLYQIFRIYDSDDITYCLMRRCDNEKYFYTTIVDAPELGKNETKFKPLSHKEVPRSIFRDSLSLIRQQKMERI